MLKRRSLAGRAGQALLPLALGLGIFAFSKTADAQQRTFYLDRLAVGGAPDDGLAMWRPVMGERTRFFGQMALGFSLNPLRIATIAPVSRERERTGNTVTTQLIDYATLGTEISNRLALSATLPVALYESGNDPRSAGVGNGVALKSVAVHDLRLEARLRLLSNAAGTFHWGLSGAYFAGIGNPFSLASDSSGHGSIETAVEGRLGDLILVGNAGVHFRPKGALGDLGVGDEVVLRAGVFYPMRDGRVRIGGEVFGSTGLGSVQTQTLGAQDTFLSGRNTPFEWMAEGRFALDQARQAWFGVGGGTRLSLGYGAPDLRLLAAIGYHFSIDDSIATSPPRQFRVDAARYEDLDSDGDGIPDSEDLCPDEPEDGLPPDPFDGCPKPPDAAAPAVSAGPVDADGDGIPDSEDACPREPGLASADPKLHGCPQFIKRAEGSAEIQILKRIEFDTAKASIHADSLSTLDEVAQLLQANPEIERLRIEGHTDDRGSVRLNEKLSADRAESVKRYLIEQGVAEARLEARGFGPARPIDTNTTTTGRQKNRRVEFHVVQSTE